MWCAECERRRYLAVNIRVRRHSADSGAIRSAGVPNPNGVMKYRPLPLHYGTAAAPEAGLTAA
jgi:hypothetical protein